jgi:hypothetical protein
MNSTLRVILKERCSELHTRWRSAGCAALDSAAAPVRQGQVRFYYRGAWREPHLKRGVAPSDVRWISERMARLSAAQVERRVQSRWLR